MTCGVGCRHSSDPALVWLWLRLASAALIQSLAWKPSYAADVAHQKKKKKKRETEIERADGGLK